MVPEQNSVTEQNSPSLRWAALGVVGTVVDKRISERQNNALRNHSAAVAALARLRRGAGKPPGSVGDILEYTLADEFAGPDSGDAATAAEIAAHISMTLHAVHQQSQPTPMHRRGYGLGHSVRRLRQELNYGEPGTPPDPVLRRFLTLGTADHLDELVHHTRGMIQLLRAQRIPLDYGVLADQLVRWQRPGGAAPIRLTWGRDFYRTHTTDNPPGGTTNTPASDSITDAT